MVESPCTKPDCNGVIKNVITNYIFIKIFMDTALHCFGRLTQERYRSERYVLLN